MFSISSILRFANLLIVFFAIYTSVVYPHFISLVSSIFLFITIYSTRNPIFLWLMTIFNQYFTLRYIEVITFKFPALFGFANIIVWQNYFSFSVFLIMLIFASIKLSSFPEDTHSWNVKKEGLIDQLSIISILFVSAPMLLDQYKIGRSISNNFFLIGIRISEFFQWTLPAIFRSPKYKSIILIYVIALFVFGSKGFLISLINLYLIDGLLRDQKLRLSHFFAISFFIFISLIFYSSFQTYRLHGEILDLFNAFNNISFDYQWFLDIIQESRKRFSGLDTMVMYGISNFHFSLLDLYYELLMAMNRFLLYFKIHIPENYISSEFFTAYYFSGIDSSLGSGRGLLHSDSMFGLSRFVTVNPVILIIAILLIFAYPFIVNFKSLYVNQLAKIYFYNSIIIGGSYEETIRIAFELLLICVLINFLAKHSFFKRL